MQLQRVSRQLVSLLLSAPAAHHSASVVLSGARSKTCLAYEEVIAHSHGAVKHHQHPGHLHGDTDTMTAILLHGLLGSGRNWRSFAKRFVAEAVAKHHRSWRLLLVDLRNHGGSTGKPGLHPPHSMESAAGDVIRLMHQVLPEGQLMSFAVIGHSMGGKVAMEMLRLLSESQQPLPQQTWVLDSQPGAVTDDLEAVSGVANVLNIVHEVQLPVSSRQALLDELRQQKGLSQPIAAWIGSNLVSDARHHLRWSFDIQGAAAMYASYRITDCWDVLERPPSGAEVHFVRGEQSDRFTPDMAARLERAASNKGDASHSGGAAQGTFHYHILQKAGHWLHTDNEAGLRQLLLCNMIKGT